MNWSDVLLMGTAVATCGEIAMIYTRLAGHHGWPSGSFLDRDGVGAAAVVVWLAALAWTAFFGGWLAAALAFMLACALTYAVCYLLQKWAQVFGLMAFPGFAALLAHSTTHFLMR